MTGQNYFKTAEAETKNSKEKEGWKSIVKTYCSNSDPINIYKESN